MAERVWIVIIFCGEIDIAPEVLQNLCTCHIHTMSGQKYNESPADMIITPRSKIQIAMCNLTQISLLCRSAPFFLEKVKKCTLKNG